MAVFNKFDNFVQELGKGTHNLATGVIKAMFTNVAPVATNTDTANLTEIAAGGGYTAGGVTLTTTGFTNTTGTSKLVLVDYTFTATGATSAFRYVALYNSSAATNKLIGWYDYGSSVTLAASETITIDFDQVNGVLTLA